jgi:uncharacterized protein YjbI with pentapeptide repeats
MPRTSVMSAKELLERYAAGERSFWEATLESANLSRTKLANADLRGANLRGANLSSASLSDANLTNAFLNGADLGRANFSGADLSGANLSRASLNRANFNDAHFTLATLRIADLNGADLRRAVFRQADLSGADLSSTDLRGADLTHASLRDANLTRARLQGATVSQCRLAYTLLIDLPLSEFCRDGVNWQGPCTVDFASIVRSVHEPQLRQFLRHTGMPDVFVEYMVDCARSLDPRVVFSLLQSTFISYGGPDEAFARKLNEALEERGVTTFFFKDDAPLGEKLHHVMRNGVNDHDRVILVCSQASLQRAGVLNELEETLARESRDGGRTYLLPVRIDDYVIDGWKPEKPGIAQAVRDRVIADFREHGDASKFSEELAKLVKALKRPETAVTDPLRTG